MVLSLTVLDDRRRKCFNPKAVSLYELNDSCWMHGRNVEKPFQDSLEPRAVPRVFAPHLTATPSRGHVGCTPPPCPLLRCLRQPNPLFSPALARDPSAEEHGCSSERWALQKDLSISSSSSWKIFFPCRRLKQPLAPQEALTAKLLFPRLGLLSHTPCGYKFVQKEWMFPFSRHSWKGEEKKNQQRNKQKYIIYSYSSTSGFFFPTFFIVHPLLFSTLLFSSPFFLFYLSPLLTISHLYC